MAITLTNSPQFPDNAALRAGERRLRGSQQKNAVEPYVLTG